MLVNNAGDCDPGAFLPQELERQQAAMDVKYCGAVRSTLLLLPGVIARGRTLGGEMAHLGIKAVVFVAAHTDTVMGRRTRFNVEILPIPYTVTAAAYKADGRAL